MDTDTNSQDTYRAIVPVRAPMPDASVNAAYYQHIGSKGALFCNVPYDKKHAWLRTAQQFVAQAKGTQSFTPLYGKDAHSVFVHLSDLYAQGQQGFFITPPTSVQGLDGEKQPSLVFYDKFFDALARSSMKPTLLLYNSCARSRQLPVERLEAVLENPAVVGVVQNVYTDTRHLLQVIALKEKLAAKGKHIGVYVDHEEHALPAMLLGATGALFATARIGLTYGADLTAVMARISHDNPMVQKEKTFLTALAAGDWKKLESMVQEVPQRGTYLTAQSAETLPETPSFAMLNAVSYLGNLASHVLKEKDLKHAVTLQRNIHDVVAEAREIVGKGLYPSLSEYFEEQARSMAYKVGTPKPRREIAADADELFVQDDNIRTAQERAAAASFHSRLAARNAWIQKVIEKDIEMNPNRNIRWWGSGIVFADTDVLQAYVMDGLKMFCTRLTTF